MILKEQFECEEIGILIDPSVWQSNRDQRSKHENIIH